MQKLTRNQWIAVAVSVVVTILFLYGQTIVSLFESFSSRIQESSNTTDTTKEKTNMNTSDSDSNLNIQDIVVGTGAEATIGSIVTVHYTGTLLDGSKFDSSLDRGVPFRFRLGRGEVIRGWDEGVAGMKVGGKRKLTIPPSLAYGGVAGHALQNETLVFEVDMLDVQNQ